MAEIRPLRAWRYNRSLIQDIDNLTAPLFDVVSLEQRNKLYQNPLNSIHLSVPDGKNHAEKVQSLVQEWKSKGIILQDDVPGFYVYYQNFSLPGSIKRYCRKGFIANIRIYDWDEKELLRHENTMPHSVQDRMEVLDASQMNISPTHGLYTDPTFEIEGYLDKSMETPLYESEDYQGVRDVLSVIHDVKTINRIREIIKGQKIILADGHHRYQGSLDYKKKMEKSSSYDIEDGYNFHMMYFTNTESDDLRILPTHRLISGLDNLNISELPEKLDEFFTVRAIDNLYDIHEIILGKPYKFGLVTQNGAYTLRLKEGLEKTIDWKFPEVINKLDLTVLHYYVIEKCLGIHGKDQRKSPYLSFESNQAKAINLVMTGKAQMALITQEVSIETVKEVCSSGYTLPQKSTYFYPKVISGFLFGSIHPDEFHSPFDKAFK